MKNWSERPSHGTGAGQGRRAQELAAVMGNASARASVLAVCLVLCGCADARAQQSAPAGAKSARTGSHATAVGHGAVASGLSSAAFGENAQASGAGSVAIGGRALNDEGEPAVEDDDHPAIARATRADSGGTAVGAGALATSASSAYGLGAEATGSFGTALGGFARAEGGSSLAVGLGAVARVRQSVALGAGSDAVAVNSVAIGATSEAMRAGTVSVGRVGAERQITNVAPGAQATDAVNLSQLQMALGALRGSLNDINGKLDELSSRVALLDKRGTSGSNPADRVSLKGADPANLQAGSKALAVDSGGSVATGRVATSGAEAPVTATAAGLDAGVGAQPAVTLEQRGVADRADTEPVGAATGR